MVPTLFTFLGIGDEERGTDAGLHTPTFKLDERQLSLGVAMRVRGALLMLEHYQSPDVEPGNELPLGEGDL